MSKFYVLVFLLSPTLDKDLLLSIIFPVLLHVLLITSKDAVIKNIWMRMLPLAEDLKAVPFVFPLMLKRADT